MKPGFRSTAENISRQTGAHLDEMPMTATGKLRRSIAAFAEYFTEKKSA
jgi:hypothetical protein